MKELKELTYEKNILIRKQVLELVKKKGDASLHSITPRSIFYGMRGLPLLYSPTSIVHTDKGVYYRGFPLITLLEKLPKFECTTVPSTEALFWFLLTGEIPNLRQTEELRTHLLMRSHVPHHVFAAIDNLPIRSRPMSRFCVALLCWTTSSTFIESYDKGIPKEDYWSLSYADALSLISGLHEITSYIYTQYCRKTNSIGPDFNLDWAGNLSHMMGIDDPKLMDFMRLFIYTHADHGPANASAHACHLVGSTLVNAFYTCVASMLTLAGPLHGHANEETFKWLLKMQESTQKKNEPITADKISRFIQNELEQGRKIPGYGHAALRIEDPRFTLIRSFLKKQNIQSEYISLVDQVYEIAPQLLKKQGKITNPNPNIDAVTGAALYSAGITEFDFYTVLFGTGRSIGLMAQHIIDRILGIPIERPSAFNLEKFIAETEDL